MNLSLIVDIFPNLFRAQDVLLTVQELTADNRQNSQPEKQPHDSKFLSIKTSQN
jgi:hypothetical protein